MSEETVERFSAVQVWVHFLLAATIFVLFLTGLALTFGDHVGWIVVLLGSENIVLIHIVAGISLFALLVYYLFYVISGVATGEVPTAWIPTPGTISEALQDVFARVGGSERPRAGKYTWIQKSEILIISVEVTMLTLTGLLLTFPGLLLAYKPAFLAVSDIHAIFAFTLLMGVTFHLYDRHIGEFPLDTSMFTGRVSMEQAREEWAGWVDGEPLAGEGPGLREYVGGAVVVLVFAVIYSGIMIDRILAPVPGTSETLYFLERPETVLDGAGGPIWAIGLNLVVVVVIVGGTVALLYGMRIRYADR